MFCGKMILDWPKLKIVILKHMISFRNPYTVHEMIIMSVVGYKLLSWLFLGNLLIIQIRITIQNCAILWPVHMIRKILLLMRSYHNLIVSKELSRADHPQVLTSISNLGVNPHLWKVRFDLPSMGGPYFNGLWK